MLSTIAEDPLMPSLTPSSRQQLSLYQDEAVWVFSSKVEQHPCVWSLLKKWFLKKFIEEVTYIYWFGTYASPCFFQVAFVESPDSIIQIQTVHSFAILWQSPWAIWGTVYLINPSLCLAKFCLSYLKHFETTFLLIAGVFFFPHLSPCCYIVDMSIPLPDGSILCVTLPLTPLVYCFPSAVKQPLTLLDRFMQLFSLEEISVMFFAGCLLSHHCAPSPQN